VSPKGPHRADNQYTVNIHQLKHNSTATFKQINNSRKDTSEKKLTKRIGLGKQVAGRKAEAQNTQNVPPPPIQQKYKQTKEQHNQNTRRQVNKSKLTNHTITDQKHDWFVCILSSSFFAAS
jgi:chorismate mutase